MHEITKEESVTVLRLQEEDIEPRVTDRIVDAQLGMFPIFGAPKQCRPKNPSAEIESSVKEAMPQSRAYTPDLFAEYDYECGRQRAAAIGLSDAHARRASRHK
jgi:hypothetical protein